MSLMLKGNYDPNMDSVHFRLFFDEIIKQLYQETNQSQLEGLLSFFENYHNEISKIFLNEFFQVIEKNDLFSFLKNLIDQHTDSSEVLDLVAWLFYFKHQTIYMLSNATDDFYQQILSRMHEEIPAQLFLSCLNLIVNLNYASIDLRIHSLTNQLYEEVGGLVSFHEDSDTISSFMCYLKVLLYVDNSIIFPLIDRISEFFHSYLSINNEINIYSLQGYCKCLEIQPYTIHHLIRTQQIYFILENLLNPNPEVTIEVMKFITIILTKCDNEIKCSIPINFEQWSILSQSESHEIKELFCLYTKLIINSNWMLIIPMYTANVFHCLLNIITCDTYFKLKKLAIEPLLIALEQFDTEQIEEIISVEFIDTCFDLINSCDEQMNLQIVKCFKYLLCVGMNGKIISKIYSAELVEKLNDALDLLKNSDVEEVRYEAMNLSQKIFKVCDEIDEESY